MAAIKNKCNNDILLLPRASRVFHNCPSRLIFTYQPLVMAIFTISFKYDRRYGLFIKIMRKYNFKIFSVDFNRSLSPRSRDQAHSPTTLGLRHTRGLGLGWQEHQSFSSPSSDQLLSVFFQAVTADRPTDPSYFRVCLSILWKSTVQK